MTGPWTHTPNLYPMRMEVSMSRLQPAWGLVVVGEYRESERNGDQEGDQAWELYSDLRTDFRIAL